MRLTVVTATYNCVSSGRGRMLTKCIESVSRLKCAHQHLIMDGASVDGTVDLVRVAKENHRSEEIQVYSEKDGGIYEALNKGLGKAEGEWFYVLGADDWIADPAFLDGLVAGGIADAFDMIVAPVWISEDMVRRMNVLMRHELCSMSYPHQGLLMRTEFVRRLGGFDEEYHISADYDLVLRALIANAAVKFVNHPFAVYNLKGISSCNKKCGEENAQIRKSLLGIKDSENYDVVHRRVVPFHVFARFVFHRSRVLRAAARFQLVRWVARCVRLI